MDCRGDDGNGNRRTTSKRGHQHHIRNGGARRSNVPAEEVIAALRSGDVLAVVDDDGGGSDNASGSDQLSSSQYSDVEMTMAVDNDNNCMRSATDGDGDEMLKADNHDIDNNNAARARRTASKVLTDSTTGRLNEMNVTRRSTGSAPSRRAAGTRNSRNLETGTDEAVDLEQIDSMSSGSSSSNKKSQRDASKKGRSSKLADDPARKERRRRKAAAAAPAEERPPLEGAADDADMADIENDPEVAEWSKLRCTSERTEVVAEREYRRQNRRCADYPGLAFGRSIFSSDTMMKLNIIRNELHNIMKTQLKRVRIGKRKWTSVNITERSHRPCRLSIVRRSPFQIGRLFNNFCTHFSRLLYAIRAIVRRALQSNP